MKIGFIQFAPRFGNKKTNLKKIRRLIASVGTDLLVFPEMCTTGYMVKNKMELRKLAEVIPNGQTIRELTQIAKENNSCLIVGMPEIYRGKIFSTAVVISPKGVIAKHQKSHLFLKEKFLFNKGETKPTLFKWKGINIGLGVCYDYMFPEYWRTLALKKADIFCNVANFVYDYGFTLMRSRSIENGVYSITVNRTGIERGQKFRGGSEIISNRGKIIKKSGRREEIYVVDLNLLKSRNKKWNKYNDLLEDRRLEMYNII